MDVHVFLFSDMLLLCKNLTKVKGDKGSSGGTGHHYGPATGSANPYGPGTDAKVKVIRQPYVIDRLVVVDITKEGHSGSQGIDDRSYSYMKVIINETLIKSYRYLFIFLNHS